MQATNGVAIKRDNRSRVMLVCSLVALLSGCKVGAEDIEYWKGTVKGPGKLVAVMLADKYEMDLRTRAALALVEMDRTDKDGTQELQQALQRLDETTRTEIVSKMIPGLEAQMRQRDPKVEGSASPAQIRAKDAAFVLTNHASPEGKARLTQAVVGWYVEDFNGRSLAGHYSAEQVVRELGSPAAKVLVGGLEAKLPQQALVKMAQLIGQLADETAKKEAANRLVAIQQEMEGEEFLNWIKKTIQEQAAESGKELDAARLTLAAQLNRDNFINEGALPAMKWLSDVPVVKQRLLTLASTPATTEAGNTRRVRALQALEGKVGKEDLQQVLALALDANSPTEVRDYAFDRVGDIKSPEALPSLWPLVTNTQDQRLRWRAGELVLNIGGPAVVEELFAKLPSGAEYPPEELEGYATRMGQMNPLPTEQARKLLGSANWYARVAAILFLERRGNQDDLKRLQALTSDKAAIKGPRWGKAKTVGDVAEEALENTKKAAGAQ
jgi:HEAT repeat protein